MTGVNIGEFLTVAEAARALGVSPITVWRWVNRGRLNAYRVGPRSIRIPRHEIDTMIQPARASAPPLSTENGLKPSTPLFPEEIERRKALVARALELRQKSVIAPLTTADLVHMAREEEVPDVPGR